MESLIVIIAIWLVGIGIVGIWPLLRTPRLKAPAAPKFVQTPLTVHIEREVVAPRSLTGEPTPVRPPAVRTAPVFQAAPTASAAPVARPVRPRTAAQRTNPLAMFQADPNAGDPYAEVSQLRAQIEHLRSELVAKSAPVEHEDKSTSASRARRYKVGAYAELPRPLRRQVREVRNERRPVRARAS